MTTRALAAEQRIMSAATSVAGSLKHGQVERVVFDKAEQAEALARLRNMVDWLQKEIKATEDQLSDSNEPQERERLGTQLERLQLRRDWVAEKIQKTEKDLED